MISVIVPVYNCEKYIEKCIKSIQCQTVQDIEIILVNDGSMDNSGNLCKKLAEQDKRIRVIDKENGGAASARNCGLDVAIGEYIAFVDSDDYIHPQMYEILLDIIHRTNADISACHYQFVKPNESIDFCKYEKKDYLSTRSMKCSEILEHFDEHCRKVSLISPCMRLCKASLFKDLQFEEGYIEEDSMLLPNLLSKASRIEKTNLPLYFWSENPKSVTRASFSPKRFAFVMVSYLRVQFFEDRGDERLSRIFRREFMNRCVAFKIKADETNNSLEFKKYIFLYKESFWRFILSSDFCRLELIMHCLFFLHVPLYKYLYKKLQLVDPIYLK